MPRVTARPGARPPAARPHWPPQQRGAGPAGRGATGRDAAGRRPLLDSAGHHNQAAQPELFRPQPGRTEPSQAEPSAAEPSRAEPDRAEPGRAQRSRAQQSRARPLRGAAIPSSRTQHSAARAQLCVPVPGAGWRTEGGSPPRREPGCSLFPAELGDPLLSTQRYGGRSEILKERIL